MRNEERNTTLKKGLFPLVFGEVINTNRGFICGVNVEPLVETEVAAPVLKDQPVNINCFRELLEHPSEAKTRAVAKCCGMKLTGTFEVHFHCVRAKAKRANVPRRLSKKRSKTQPERLHFHVSSTKAKSFGGPKFWLLIVDDATGCA